MAKLELTAELKKKLIREYHEKPSISAFLVWTGMSSLRHRPYNNVANAYSERHEMTQDGYSADDIIIIRTLNLEED
jgi:hypothetical protein